MIRKALKIVACFSAAISCSALAARQGTALVFGNGMFTEEWEAAVNLSALKKRISASSIDQQYEYTPVLTYNRNEFAITQLVQVARQKGLEANYRLYAWLASAEVAPDWFRQALLETASEFMRQTYIDSGDLQNQSDVIRGLLTSGNRVLLVSHSQGNFYANQAWSKVFTGNNALACEQSFGNVQVATPASEILATNGKFSNTTFVDDKIMAAVRSTFGALPATPVTIIGLGSGEPPRKDPDGHNFIKAYLKSILGQPKITNDIYDVANSLRDPDSCMVGITDLSPAASDSAALADLINDTNNLDPTPVAPTRALYIEGTGLEGAVYEVPGLYGEYPTATAVDLPASHPLSAAGSKVWKLMIPAWTTTLVTGKIKAWVNVDGTSQSFESPRSIRIDGAAEWRISRVGYAVPYGGRLTLGSRDYFCPEKYGAPYPGHPGYQSAGFVGAVKVEQNGTQMIRYDPNENLSEPSNTWGWNSYAVSTFCASFDTPFPEQQSGSTELVSSSLWVNRVGAYDNPNWGNNSFGFSGFMEQKKRTDGMCDIVLQTQDCVGCEEGSARIRDTSYVATCKIAPDAADFRILWDRSTYSRSGKIGHPHWGGMRSEPTRIGN